MYLSRLIVSNYRSIKYLDLKFSPTKNVIIGHNNAGKSNIVKAINIILGEQTPDYKKYENITERDFFNGNEDKIFIIGEISRKQHSSIDFKVLKENPFGSYKVVENSLKESYESENFKEFVNKIFDVNFEDESLKKRRQYVKFKNVDEDELKDELNNIDKFIYVFKAEKNENNEIDKSFRLVLVKDGSWTIFQRPFMRNEILLSMTVPPFRDPEYQLKPTSWNWFGKLIKSFLRNSLGTSGNHLGNLENARNAIKKLQMKSLKL